MSFFAFFVLLHGNIHYFAGNKKDAPVTKGTSLKQWRDSGTLLVTKEASLITITVDQQKLKPYQLRLFHTS